MFQNRPFSKGHVMKFLKIFDVENKTLSIPINLLISIVIKLTQRSGKRNIEQYLQKNHIRL